MIHDPSRCDVRSSLHHPCRKTPGHEGEHEAMDQDGSLYSYPQEPLLHWHTPHGTGKICGLGDDALHASNPEDITCPKCASVFPDPNAPPFLHRLDPDEIQPVGLYRHSKGGLYRVLFTGMNSSNNLNYEPTVCYVSLTSGEVFFREHYEFNEPVNWPDGTRQPRFRPEKP